MPIKLIQGGGLMKEVGSMISKTEKCLLIVIILVLSIALLIGKIKDVIPLG